MAFQVLFGEGAQDADDIFYDQLLSLEVEENADLPGAVQLTIRIASEGPPGREDLTRVGEDRLRPYARIAVVAASDEGPDACIFDGHVLAHKIHVDRGTTAATLQVWGQDISCLMNLKEVVKEWSNKTDGQIANAIFGDYQLAKASGNVEDDSGQHTEAGNTVMQRATDAQFLRDRARRSGKLFRVCCSDRPGQNTGYFMTPSLQGSPAATFTLNPPEEANVEALDFAWDVARPTRVLAQALLAEKTAEQRNTGESGLALLDSQSLAAFTGSDRRLMEARLTGTADSADDLRQRARSLLREAGWFVRCEGEVELAQLKAVLRAATVVQIDGAGKLHSGKYFVWSVRHTITAQSHLMRFVLVRNAVGSF